MSPPAGLVLAAGAGSRFGGPKALVRLDGELLVERAAGMLNEGGCDPVVVVLGAQAELVRAVGTLPRVIVADDWATGMGASLRAGLAGLAGSASQACVVALADQPLVGPEAVRRLCSAWVQGAVAAVATYDGQPRNPVLLARSTWPEVAALAQGDAGARAWLRANPGLVTPVPCDGTGSPFDIDTPADLVAVTSRDAPARDAPARDAPARDARRVHTP